MKIRLALFVALFALLLGACGAPDWQDFNSSEGNFSVSMPGAPEQQTENVSTAVGDISLNMFIVDRGTSAYMVSYSDYPTDMISIAGPDTVLDGAVQGAVGNVGGTIVNQQNIEIDGHPGREVELSIPQSADMDEGHAKARIFLVDERLYQVLALGTNDDLTMEDANRFLESFKLSN